jgi:NAD+ kinase
MKNPKVLLIYKESAYRQYLSSKQLIKNLKKGSYWKVVWGSHQRHNRTLEGVRKTLRQMGWDATLVLRERVSRLGTVDDKFGLVISVGGDGTLLDASHLVEKTPVLGVNSDPMRSVARFSGSDLQTFPKVLKDYLEGRLKPKEVPRLEFSLNGKRNRWLVMNDLLVCTLSPAGTSRYVLKAGGRMEEQMSSGIWISTAAGSTAAIYSAGGRVLPPSSRKFQFVVREAYQKKFGPRHLLKGVLGATQTLEVVSYMKEGRVFIDGANLEIPFRTGDRLKVGLSHRPLKVIGLKNQG